MSELYMPEDPDLNFYELVDDTRARNTTWRCKKCGWRFKAVCHGDMDDWWIYNAHIRLEDHKAMCKLLEE